MNDPEKSNVESWCEGYATARAETLHAAYAAIERFGIKREDFARVLVGALDRDRPRDHGRP